MPDETNQNQGDAGNAGDTGDTSQQQQQQPPSTEGNTDNQQQQATGEQTNASILDSSSQEQVFTPKLPDGMEFDKPLVEQFQKWVSENKVAPDSAQKMVDGMVARQNEIAQEHAKLIEQRRTEMLNTINQDPELGKDLDVTRANCKKAIQQFGTEELQKLFDERIDNMDVNPHIARLLFRIGKELGEDKLGATHQSNQQQTLHDRNKQMYPNSPELWGPKQ